jgi:SAM-dependent methyltransferase
MVVLQQNYPDWRNAVVHESSPGNRGVSLRLQKECERYIPSQYFKDTLGGKQKNGVRCENLESLTFGDGCVDIHITQDVMEHVFHPARAFTEIARTLAPGGVHIFSVPLVNKRKPSVQRAKRDEDGTIIHLMEPVYHGNPIGDGRSLVTFDWGFDICEYIFQWSGLFTQIYYIDDPGKGIKAEYIEILVSCKSIGTNLSEYLQTSGKI